jgi:uncharacterized protein YcbK (DUF882 family)
MDNKQRMTEADWLKMKYMTKKENWGDPLKISKKLVYNMEDMRIFINKPIVLTCAAYSNSGHTTNSQHGFGNAADYKIANSTLLEMYITAERFNFTGIGLYPNNGNPFVHVDVRDQNDLDVQSRWIAIGDPNKWTYVELNEQNFKKYVLI